MLDRNNCQRLRMIACLLVPCRKMKKDKTFSIHLVRVLKIWLTLFNSKNLFFFFHFHLFINRIKERVWCIWVTKDDFEIKQYQIKGQLFHNYCWNFDFRRRMIAASIHFYSCLKRIEINMSTKQRNKSVIFHNVWNTILNDCNRKHWLIIF